MVQEELLRLVEHDVEIATEKRSPGFEPVRERAVRHRQLQSVIAERIPDGSRCGGHHALNRIALPIVEHRYSDLGRSLVLTAATGLGTEVMSDPGAKNRALADPGLPVQHGEPGGDEVRDDQLPVSIAAEEEWNVGIGVVERPQALVRRELSMCVNPSSDSQRDGRGA